MDSFSSSPANLESALRDALRQHDGDASTRTGWLRQPVPEDLPADEVAKHGRAAVSFRVMCEATPAMQQPARLEAAQAGLRARLDNIVVLVHELRELLDQADPRATHAGDARAVGDALRAAEAELDRAVVQLAAGLGLAEL